MFRIGIKHSADSPHTPFTSTSGDSSTQLHVLGETSSSTRAHDAADDYTALVAAATGTNSLDFTAKVCGCPETG